MNKNVFLCQYLQFKLGKTKHLVILLKDGIGLRIKKYNIMRVH